MLLISKEYPVFYSTFSINQVHFFQEDIGRFNLLDETTKKIVNVLISHLNHFRMKICWPSYDRIGKLAGCSASTVKRRMKWLRHVGILKLTPRRNRSNGHRRSHLYRLADMFYDPWMMGSLRYFFPALWFSLRLLAPRSRSSDRGLSTKRDPICLYSDFFINNKKPSNKRKRVKKSPRLLTPSTKDPTKGNAIVKKQIESPPSEIDHELLKIMQKFARTAGIA